MAMSTPSTNKNVFKSYGQWEARFLHKDYIEDQSLELKRDVAKESEDLANKAINHLIQLKQ